MAFHQEEFGHTKLVIGGMYTPSLRGYWKCQLISFNEVTGMATMCGFHNEFFIRLSQLSRWHLMQTS